MLAIKIKLIKQNQQGFSLMELLVAMSVFVIVATASLSIYASILRAGQKTTALTSIQQEAQLIMSVLAKKIRTSRLDYNYSGYADGINEAETELALVDLVGDHYLFKYANKVITVAVNDAAEQPLSMGQVRIDDLKFFINPKTNPFNLDAPPLSQPYVTVTMTVSATKAGQQASLIVQETVPQRSGLVKH